MIKLLFVIAVLAAIGGFLWAKTGRAGVVPSPGRPAPDFSLPDQSGAIHHLKGYRGQWVVLYFYPKDDTPACTQEACSFRDDWMQLKAMGAQVVGISVDDTASHQAFADKYHLPFPLLADRDGKVAATYGALWDFGLLRFAKRYTFLVNPQGDIARAYLKVDTSRHSREVIADLKALIAK